MSDGRLPVIDYSRHPAYDLAPDPELGGRALEALRPLVEQMTEVEERRRRTFGYRYGATTPEGRALVRDGSLRLQIGAAAMQRITTAAAPLVDALEARMAAIAAPNFAQRMAAVDNQADAELWNAVMAGLQEIEALRLAQDYYSAPGAKVRTVAVMISRPQDKESVFQGFEAPEIPAVGMHVDSSGRCILKAMLYLSEVGPGDGPFGAVRGSHRWNPDGQDRIYRRAYDKSPLVSRRLKERRSFISLPKEMQVKAEFGGDLMPDWPETQSLLRDEIVSLGPPGLVSLFDPECVHRGGMAQTGTRRAIQVLIGALY